MPLIYQQQNINADMDAPQNDLPDSFVGPFKVLSLSGAPLGSLIAVVTPNNQNLESYVFELAFWPDTASGLQPSQMMWDWSGADREELTLDATAGNPADAQRLNTRYFLITPPAGHPFGYVRLSDLAGAGNPAAALAVWSTEGQ